MRSESDKANLAWNKAETLNADMQRRFRTGQSVDAAWWERRRKAIACLRVYAKRAARKRLAESGFSLDILGK